MDRETIIQTVSNAEQLLNQGQYIACIRECGAAIEDGMRILLVYLVTHIKDVKARRTLIAAQENCSRGKAIDDLALGHLVQLYLDETVGVWQLLREHYASNFSRAEKLDWKQVVNWRNAAAHGKDNQLSPDDAYEMFVCAKRFLYDSELLGRHGIKPEEPNMHGTDGVCYRCGSAIQSAWQYCGMCGIRLVRSCLTCKRQVEPEWQICPYCENKISEPDSAEQAQTKERYRTLCRGAWLDGVVNARERNILRAARLEYGLTAEEASDIERSIAPPAVVKYSAYVEAALFDGEISDGERKFLNDKANELSIDPWVVTQLEDTYQELLMNEWER